MATVFMKWLETNPGDYDRGIRLITLGRIRRTKERIAGTFVREGMRVLEIGCGTGTLTMMMAGRGAAVVGIDASPRMLAEAERKRHAAHLEERVTLQLLDATLIGERFAAGSFDLIVSTLVFSELSAEEQRYVLGACKKLLAPGGRILIADEVIPGGLARRLWYSFVRWPLVFVTWLITRTTTASLRDFPATFAAAGLTGGETESWLGGSLALFEIHPGRRTPAVETPAAAVPCLRHRVTVRTLLLDLWLLFFRIIPPYPRVRPGLYAVGRPDSDSPVLVTGNFDLTVRRLVKAVDGKVDAWVLVADSAGINVWCAAGGGHFTAEKVIAVMRSSRVKEVVRHHALILPQLCANGVDGWRIRKETGWGVHWGPVRAADIPAYLAGKRKKTDEMRRVTFPLMARLEMATAAVGMNAFLVLVPVILFWRSLFWPATIALVALIYFYAAVHPRFPGNSGLSHGVSLSIFSFIALLAYSMFVQSIPVLRLFHWGIGLAILSVFTAAEMPGMSPLMRSGETNYVWEFLIAAALALAYWLLPLALGWR